MEVARFNARRVDFSHATPECVIGVGGLEPFRIRHRGEAASRVGLLDARAVELDDKRLLSEVVALQTLWKRRNAITLSTPLYQ